MSSKADKLYKDLMAVFRKHKPIVKDILLAYSNLGYNLGASIGGYKDKGPSVQELELMYATNPNIAVSLMINAINMNMWVDDLEKTVEDIKKEQEKKND
jgi:hypothetical protein